MSFSNPLVMMLMEQEDEDQRKKEEESRRAADALKALQASWRGDDDEGPYARY